MLMVEITQSRTQTVEPPPKLMTCPIQKYIDNEKGKDILVTVLQSFSPMSNKFRSPFASKKNRKNVCHHFSKSKLVVSFREWNIKQPMNIWCFKPTWRWNFETAEVHWHHGPVVIFSKGAISQTQQIAWKRLCFQSLYGNSESCDLTKPYGF